MNYNLIFMIISHIVFVFCLSYYCMSALQWYSYRVQRVLLHYHKPLWHLIFFIAPIFLYYFFFIFFKNEYYFFIFLYFAYIPMLIFWHKKLDKPLIFTNRVKRFFIILAILLVFFNMLFLFYFKQALLFSIFIPLVTTIFLSNIYEKIAFLGFKKSAIQKLNNHKNLITIAITASYGKTSIKNFLHHILSYQFNCYKTPRSVNTLSGLVLDVNTSLPKDAKIYIAEAGAREKGDIQDIANFLSPEIVVVGKIGIQHIEYFKTLENIRNTKMELITSKKLQKAFIHASANIKVNSDSKIDIFGDDIKIIKHTLDGLEFSIKIKDEEIKFKTSILGEFNATNLAACILVAVYLGMDIRTIQKAVLTLKSVEHRLQRIDVDSKIIIDDSFNGNFEGMKSSYELVKHYNGRKILVTPGIIESSESENEKLAKIIDDIFDLVIITGFTNSNILDKNIIKPKKIILKNKSDLTSTLANITTKKDLILFSNDTPTYM